jgi:catechol 2,3-dioxygenase-like lactoylglutathione lyase family enzyme
VTLDGRTLRAGDVVYRFRAGPDDVVTASYDGGAVLSGTLVGRLRDGVLRWSSAEERVDGSAATGSGAEPVEELADGRVRIGELEELDGQRWIRTRVAYTSGSLAACRAFYGELLGLTETGGFTDHDGYDGAFFALPGGGQLELTAGGPLPLAATGDDLLVLYLPTPDDVQDAARVLRVAGAEQVTAENPYWDRWGATFLDPDGRRVVVAAVPL